eukprot:TRINITY_DN16334_c0_g2_i1.p2 TRINITY_DN16334_c0_g2~~TRINITY_DN16334_c0_g2_i1.p2  ORF type:complete len:501 (+),score=203.73 TRINITY_DN16334_c0_g2_i1:103-1503(+)
MAARGCSDVARMNPDQWTDAFKAATVGLASMDVDTISYEESATRLRDLLKGGLLKHTDLRDNPERFFLAHRLLAQHASRLGPGFWIRFTVHYNLCVGTVLAIGSDEQVAGLTQMQEDGLLGCFALTEKFAGVSSGLVVNTTATWDAASETFLISSPNPGATKNWISQGLVADRAVVIADLRVGGKSHGPHGFFVDFRTDGEVVRGIEHGDMGKKTVGNDLDNAWIGFNGLRVPKSALLNRFGDVTADGYVQKLKDVPVFHMIGQRLFTGRVAVAQAALEFRRSIYAQTQNFADNKLCWGPQAPVALGSLPQLSSLFEANAANQAELDAFVGKCEKELCEALKSGALPSVQLVEAIAVAKVKAVEDSIRLVHELKNEVGSYALMKGSGFEQADFLVCCKFAEGDSRILMQKMVRDRLRQVKKAPPAPTAENAEELALCAKLAEKEDHKTLYALADVIMNRTIKEFMA